MNILGGCVMICQWPQHGIIAPGTHCGVCGLWGPFALDCARKDTPKG